jgi:MFS family permease
MPTDGTLILENVPKENQYLVTGLSVFFSTGSVVAAVVALFVLPGNSCPIDPNSPCDVDVQNRGWRHLLVCLAIVVCFFFLIEGRKTFC